MAKATLCLVCEVPDSTQPKFCHSEDPTEAANSVANVTRFMASALAHGGVNDKDEMDGARVILETCAETLDYHFRQSRRGGAA